MKIILVVAVCIFGVATAVPVEQGVSQPRRTLPAIKHEEVHDEHGQYSLQYVTAEGTVVREQGRLVPTNDGQSRVMVYEGEVSYVGDDGKTYVTKYSAGLGGTVVEGKHLPVSVPVPVAENQLNSV